MIVFLHGWGMNKRVFEEFVEKFMADKPTLLLDLPGYDGREPRMNFDDQVHELKQMIPAGAHLVGWSLGGLYALRLLDLFPEHISKLTMMCSSPCFAQRNDHPFALSQKVLQQFSEQLILNRDKTLERFLLLQLHGQKQAKQIARELKHRLVQQVEPSDRVLEHGLSLLKNLDLRKELKRHEKKITFILGDRDMLVPFRLLETLNEGDCFIKSHIIKGSGHIPFITHARNISILL